MSEEQLPAGPAGDEPRLPAQQGVQPRHDLAHMRPGGTALALDMLDDKRDVDPDEIDLLAYWRILVKRRRLIASVLAALVALSLLITLMTQPQYRASVLMQIEKEGATTSVASLSATPYYDSWDPDFLTTQYELLKSRTLAERVANELNLSCCHAGEAQCSRLAESGHGPAAAQAEGSSRQDCQT